jgi:adenylate cyclase
MCEVAEQLGVRYILEGSVRKSGARIRVTAQLIDARDGSHLWAERYDRAVDDIFAIQDEITLVLAMEMQVKLTEGEQARMRHTTTNNVEAWTHWARMSYLRMPVTKDNRAAAQACWEKALALDPTSAALNAMLGFAQKGRHDEAVAAARKAVQLGPGSADVVQLAGFLLTPSGYPEEAVLLVEKAMTLSPHYPPVFLGTLGDAFRHAGRLDEAIAAFEAYHARSPGFGLTDVVLDYQEKGQPEDAKRSAARLMAARPEFTIAGWRKTQLIRRDKARIEADEAALRAAGLPLG